MNHFSVFLLLSAIIFADTPVQSHAATSKKTATPAAGNAAGQKIDVNSPYCDAYAPYTLGASPAAGKPRAFTSLLSPLKYDFKMSTLNDKEEIRRFLGKHLSIGDAVAKDGSLSDPGYPILGDPKQHLYSDGTDVQRLLTRLFAVDGKGSPLATPLCQDPSTKSYSDLTASLNPNAQDTSSYYLIHIVRWKVVSGAYQTGESSWYVFNKNDSKGAHREVPFTFHPYTTGDLRILGSNKVFFLAIHLAPLGATASGSVQQPNAVQEYADFRSKVKVSYKMGVTKVEPANIQDLKALLGVITKLAPQANIAPQNPDDQTAAYMAFIDASPTRPYAGAYGAAVLTGLDHLPVQITATMQATLPKVDTTVKPAPGSVDMYEDHSVDEFTSSNTKQQAAPVPPGSATDQQSESTTGQSTSKTSTAAKSGSTGSSNSTTKGKSASSSGTTTQTSTDGCTNSSDPTCTDSAVVQNEGLYWWDVSVGVPFKGYKELQYDGTSGGSITTTTVSKGSAYGFVVLAPWKEDIVKPPSMGIPHLLIGLPLQGKVFNAPVFALGETFNVASIPKIGSSINKVYPLGIRFYCGMVYNKQFAAPEAGVSPTPSHRVAKLQFGIEFSIRSVASKLSSATSSAKSTPSASKTSSKASSTSTP